MVDFQYLHIVLATIAVLMSQYIHGMSISQVDDVVITINNIYWRCDRIYCPVDSVLCEIVKKSSNDSPNLLNRSNTCYDMNGNVLSQQNNAQVIDPHVRYNVKIMSNRNGDIISTNNAQGLFKSPQMQITTLKAPNIEISKLQIPKTELPKNDIPKIEIPNISIPKIEIPNIEMPNIEIPNIEIPKIEIPKIEIPNIEIPNIEIPNIGPSNIDVPRLYQIKMPEIELPKIDMSKIDTSHSNVPVIEITEIQGPNSEGPLFTIS